MEDAFALATYLLLSFKTPSEQEYIAFLWDAFETNYTYEKYQFAFLAYHMLTMSLVYFNIWQIKQEHPKDFEMGLVGFGVVFKNFGSSRISGSYSHPTPVASFFNR